MKQVNSGEEKERGVAQLVVVCCRTESDEVELNTFGQFHNLLDNFGGILLSYESERNVEYKSER